MQIPQDILTLMSDNFWHFAIIFLRVSAVVSVLPAFGERTVPVRVKLGLGLAFAAVVAPAISPLRGASTPMAFAGLAVSEIVIGLAFGLMIRLFILALQTAGSIAAQATSLAQLIGAAAVEPIPAMGHILVVSGLALAAGLGLHVRAAQLMIQSYDVFPVGHLPEGQILSAWGLARIAQAFRLAVTLAAPFFIASLIYNLTLGAINRAMPQLMVAFVGAPVITFGGLFVLFVSAPIMLDAWHEALTRFLANPTALLP